MSHNLHAKVAIVTGGSTGIGAAIARALAEAGASVVINYRSSKTEAEAVATAIEKTGGRAIAVGGNVSSEGDAKKVINAALDVFGRLDIIVNNAGISEFQPIEEFTSEHYERQFRTNVLGPMLIVSASLPHLQRGASIINISSSATHFAPPSSSVYTASKGALDAFTSVLANELGPRGIRVNSLKPGLTITEKSFAEGTAESDFVKTYLERTPLRRLGETADIASAAVFLASDDAGFITGEKMLVSGGLR
jgi:3-oxoacyl-[acyl-carrier protein] reductase